MLKNRWLLAVCVSSLLTWGVWLKGRYLGDITLNDDCLYMDVVRNIARGEGVTSHTAYPAHVAAHRKHFDFPVPFLVHAVLFPMLYAPAYALMGSLSALSPYLMNGLFLGITYYYLYLLAAMLAGPQVACLSVFLVSVEPIILDVAMQMNTHPAFTMFLIMASYYLLKYYKTPRTRTLLAASVCFTLVQYCRIGAVLLYAPFVAPILLRDLGKGFKQAAQYVGLSVVLLIPWCAWMWYATGSPNYSPYYIAFDYVFRPNMMTSFTMQTFMFREILAHLPELTILRQASILKDIYREVFTWMNPLVFVAGLLGMLSLRKPSPWKAYCWFAAVISAALLWPGYLSSHVYPIIVLWSIPAAAFLLDWYGKLPDWIGRALALPVLGLLLVQPFLVATFGVHGIFRNHEQKLQYRDDWRALGAWIRDHVPPEVVIYSNVAEWVAWNADRNVLFLGHDEHWTNKEMEVYPSDWILLANENRLIGGDPVWNAKIKAGLDRKEFFGYKRVGDFNGAVVKAALFHRTH